MGLLVGSAVGPLVGPESQPRWDSYVGRRVTHWSISTQAQRPPTAPPRPPSAWAASRPQGPPAALQPRMSGFGGGRAPNLLSGGPASTSMRDTTTGVVANLFGHKGYGFIRPDDCSAPRPTSF